MPDVVSISEGADKFGTTNVEPRKARAGWGQGAGGRRRDCRSALSTWAVL